MTPAFASLGLSRAASTRGSRYARLAAAALVTMMFSANEPAMAEDTTTTPAADQANALLSRIQQASRKLDYAGVFMYQQGEFTQSSRLIHVLDGTGERERLEILDGRPREYIRHNDEIQCLIPERKTVVVQHRRGDRFPGLLLGDPTTLTDYYQVKTDPTPRRIAGRECRLITLEPRDELRYGYRLCADMQTNLLLKAQTLNHAHNVVEQVVFTSLRFADQIDRSTLNSPWKTGDWKVRESSMKPVDLAALGWRVPAPPGFSVVLQVTRTFDDHDQVNQLLLSDGLAAISVFIEPYENVADAHQPKGAGRRGAINVFRLRVADFWLTALGEVPVSTLRQLAESTEYVPLAVTH